MSRLKEQYENEIKDAMIKKFGYKNTMEVPKLDKIVVNMGVGEAKENAKLLEAAVKDMEAITGQKAVTTKAKNAIANFKIRENMPIGCKVTLRGEKMYEFADRLINLALPRVRDFRGVNPNAFDGRGNYALGIKEQIIFPEIAYGCIAFSSSCGVYGSAENSILSPLNIIPRPLRFVTVAQRTPTLLPHSCGTRYFAILSSTLFL